jgi:hypothetical protein
LEIYRRLENYEFFEEEFAVRLRKISPA